METVAKTSWHGVSHKEINSVDPKPQRGIQLQYLLAPSDMPVAWRGQQTVEGDTHFLVVEFKYISEGEATEAISPEEGITYVLGRNSKRIYAIKVDLSRRENRSGHFKLKGLLPEDFSKKQRKAGEEVNQGNKIAITNLISMNDTVREFEHLMRAEG